MRSVLLISSFCRGQLRIGGRLDNCYGLKCIPFHYTPTPSSHPPILLPAFSSTSLPGGACAAQRPFRVGCRWAGEMSAQYCVWAPPPPSPSIPGSPAHVRADGCCSLYTPPPHPVTSLPLTPPAALLLLGGVRRNSSGPRVPSCLPWPLTPYAFPPF